MSKDQKSGDEGVPASRIPPLPTEIWDMQPGEPPKWYARFEVYRSLGPHRTIPKAYRVCAPVEGLTKFKPAEVWYVMSRKWAWQDRALAWDAMAREKLRADELEQRILARRQRLGMVDQVLKLAYGTLEQANLPGMSQAEARAALPTIRLIFRDTVTIQEREFGVPDVNDEEAQQGQPLTYHAEDFRRAELELNAWHRQRKGVVHRGEVKGEAGDGEAGDGER